MEVVVKRANESSAAASLPVREALTINVVFTNVEATLPAIEEAHRLADGLSSEMCILMPQVIPYALPLDRPNLEPAIRVAALYDSLFASSIRARIEVCLCRDLETAVLQALDPASLVILGYRRQCSSLRERSLAAVLSRGGHRVVLISD